MRRCCGGRGNQGRRHEPAPCCSGGAGGRHRAAVSGRLDGVTDGASLVRGAALAAPQWGQQGRHCSTCAAAVVPGRCTACGGLSGVLVRGAPLQAGARGRRTPARFRRRNSPAQSSVQRTCGSCWRVAAGVSGCCGVAGQARPHSAAARGGRGSSTRHLASPRGASGCSSCKRNVNILNTFLCCLHGCVDATSAFQRHARHVVHRDQHASRCTSA